MGQLRLVEREGRDNGGKWDAVRLFWDVAELYADGSL